MKYTKIIASLVMLLIIGSWFYWVNKYNYWKYVQIRDTYVEHPENLPTPFSAKATAFGFQNIKADWFWLAAIQYIWGNAVQSEYKKYLYQMIDVITELNPYFQHPYIIGQLLIPSHNPRYENLADDLQNANIAQAETIWLKWIANFCNPEKITLIDTQDDLLKIWSEEKYANPCKSYDIPYGLAFVYWFYLKDPLNASKYYKIASANTDAIDGAKVMAAIMQWKWWEREKSFFMFLSLAKYISPDDQACLEFANTFELLWKAVFQNRLGLSGQIMANVEQARLDTFWTFSGDDNDIGLDDTQCVSYINKSVREINLYYIEQADAKYRADNNGEPSLHAKQLFDDQYIDYLPRDFQRYEDYEVIYEYSPDTDRYDYGNGNYK